MRESTMKNLCVCKILRHSDRINVFIMRNSKIVFRKNTCISESLLLKARLKTIDNYMYIHCVSMIVKNENFAGLQLARTLCMFGGSLSEKPFAR